MDNRVVALFDVSHFNVPNIKSLILHLDFGVIIEERSTKQLMNELYKSNGLGFTVTKVLAGLLGVKSCIPFVHAYQAYMPISGGSRKNTDWISPNLLSESQVSDGVLHLVSIEGRKVSLEFVKGDLKKRLHDVALLSKASFLFLEMLANWGNCGLQPPSDLGLLEEFENCQCVDHEQMELKVKNLREMIVAFKKVILFNLGIEQFQRLELIKLYSQNLSRLKKLY